MTDHWVEIQWRKGDTLLVISSDHGVVIMPNRFLAGKHDGIWNSECMRFVPTDREYFSDGTPVAVYEGQRTYPAQNSTLRSATDTCKMCGVSAAWLWATGKGMVCSDCRLKLGRGQGETK